MRLEQACSMKEADTRYCSLCNLLLEFASMAKARDQSYVRPCHTREGMVLLVELA